MTPSRAGGCIRAVCWNVEREAICRSFGYESIAFRRIRPSCERLCEYDLRLEAALDHGDGHEFTAVVEHGDLRTLRRRFATRRNRLPGSESAFALRVDPERRHACDHHGHRQ